MGTISLIPSHQSSLDAWSASQKVQTMELPSHCPQWSLDSGRDCSGIPLTHPHPPPPFAEVGKAENDGVGVLADFAECGTPSWTLPIILDSWRHFPRSLISPIPPVGLSLRLVLKVTPRESPRPSLDPSVRLRGPAYQRCAFRKSGPGSAGTAPVRPLSPPDDDGTKRICVVVPSGSVR